MIESLPLLQPLLDIAVRAAQAPAADVLRAFLDPALQGVERKPDNSLVTKADKAAERTIREFLAKEPGAAYPVLGEEMGDDSKGSRYRWTLDPIDGTFGYTRGLPNFGTLLAFEDATVPQALVGVIHLPAFAETYSAAKGLGATFAGRRIRVTPRRELSECLVSLSSARDFQKAGEHDGYQRIVQEAGYLRGNFDCWTHAMTARGTIDVTVEYALNRWDIAATQILVEEAGGQCLIRPSRVTGKKFDCIFGSPQAVDDVARLIPF